MKKRENQFGYNGITLGYRPDSAVSNSKIKIPFFDDITRALLSVIAALGALLTGISILDLKVETYVPIVVSIVSALGFNFAIKKVKKPSLILLAAAIVCVAMLLFAYPTIEKGSIILFEQGKTAISKSMYWDTPKFTYPWKSAYYSETNLVFGMLSLLLTIVISYFVSVKTSFLAIFLLTFPFFEIGAAFGCVPDYFAFALMLASWAAMLAFYQANHVKRNSKKKKRVAAQEKGKFAGSAIVIAAITLALFFGGKEFLIMLGMSRSGSVENLRTEVKVTVEEVVDYITGEDNDGSLKEGKLLELDDHKIKDRHYFKMETSLQSIKENLYLRGYTATKYTGTEWQQSDSYDKYKLLFDKLSQSSYRMSAITGTLIKTHADYGKFEEAHITLSDFRRVKNYIYGAAIPNPDETFKPVYDYTLEPKNKEKYSYDVFINSDDRFKITESATYKLKIFSNLMNEYSKLVGKEYTASTSTEKVRELVDSFESENIYKLVDEVRKYLSENIEYTFIVNKSPQNVDFVENFLFNEKKGYSTHYATAAAVLLQTAGVPTRYVEGYCVLTEDFNKTKTDNEYGWITFDVTDKYAHAWIEIYDETFGWIPVDVTPSFYSGSFFDYMQQFIEDHKEEETIEEPMSGGEEESSEVEEIEVPSSIESESVLEEMMEEERLENEKKEKEEKAELIRMLLIVGIPVATVLFAIIGFFSAHIIIVKRRNKRLRSDSPEISIYESYRYFRKLARSEGISPQFASYYEYISRCADESVCLEGAELNEVFEIILRNSFSKDGVDKGSVETVAAFVKAYAMKLYKSRKFFKRIKFRFINHLI